MIILTLTLSINPNANRNPLPVRRSGPQIQSLHFMIGPNVQAIYPSWAKNIRAAGAVFLQTDKTMQKYTHTKMAWN